MNNLRVAFICQWWAPEPVLVPRWIEQGLRRGGMDTEVLTGVPNYPEGRAYPGYRAWRTYRERVGTTLVHRTPLYPSHDGRPGHRIANYLSWSISAALLSPRRLARCDVALVYSSPATAALPAMSLKLLLGTPYVLLVQDVWPDSVRASGMSRGWRGRVVGRVLETFVKLTYRWASKVVVTSPGMVDLLTSRGLNPDKITQIYNWVGDDPAGGDTGTHRLRLRQELNLGPQDFVLMYAGNLGRAQGLDTAVEAMGLAQVGSSCHLVLVGDGIERPLLERLAREHAPDRVHFLGAVPREEVTNLMSQAHAQLVSLSNDPLFSVTTPSKVQAILAAGHPMLAVASGDVASLVRETGAGIAVRPGHAVELAHAVQQLSGMSREALQAMGACGQRHYERNMREEVGAARLGATLKEAAYRNHRSPGRRAKERLKS